MADETASRIGRDVTLLLVGAILSVTGGIVSQAWSEHVQDAHDAATVRRAQQGDAAAAMWSIYDPIDSVLAAAQEATAASARTVPVDSTRARAAELAAAYRSWRARRLRTDALATIYFPYHARNVIRDDSAVMFIARMALGLAARRIEADKRLGHESRLQEIFDRMQSADSAASVSTTALIQADQQVLAVDIKNRVTGSLDPTATMPAADAREFERELRQFADSVDSAEALTDRAKTGH